MRNKQRIQPGLLVRIKRDLDVQVSVDDKIPTNSVFVVVGRFEPGSCTIAGNGWIGQISNPYLTLDIVG